MDKHCYTLRELSDELDISIRELRKQISKGKLKAKKVGRSYSVEDADLDDFINTRYSAKNYMCDSYSKCLDKAARANKSFSCEDCAKFARTSSVMDDIFPLWDSTFSSPLSIQ